MYNYVNIKNPLIPEAHGPVRVSYRYCSCRHCIEKSNNGLRCKLFSYFSKPYFTVSAVAMSILSIPYPLPLPIRKPMG